MDGSGWNPSWGSAAWGSSIRATYLKTGQQVALKVLAPDLSLDPKVAKRFEREMDILRKLKHPHIIRYYGGSSSGAQRYYAMELLSGGALDGILKKKGGGFTWRKRSSTRCRLCRLWSTPITRASSIATSSRAICC
ncbi:MAG: protein kinase [Planctomycetaceae bacterium]